VPHHLRNCTTTQLTTFKTPYNPHRVELTPNALAALTTAMASHIDKPDLAAILHKMANFKARDIDAGMSHLNRSGLFLRPPSSFSSLTQLPASSPHPPASTAR
jgi:hypothetical protein